MSKDAIPVEFIEKRIEMCKLFYEDYLYEDKEEKKPYIYYQECLKDLLRAWHEFNR